MSFKTEVTLSCDKAGCKNKVEAVSRKLAKKAARADGWQLKGTKTALCKIHRPVVAAKKEKTAKKAKSGKKATTKKVNGKTGKVNARGNVLTFDLNKPSTDKPN